MSDLLKTAPLAAVACALSGMMVIGLIDNFIIYIAETASLWQFHSYRAAMILPMLAIMSYLRWGRLRPRNLLADSVEKQRVAGAESGILS